MAPLLQNGLAVCRSQNVPLGRVCRWIGLLLLIALPAGLAVVLFTNYSTGIVSQPDTWAYTDPPQDPFRATIESIQKLSLDGQLASSNALCTAQRAWLTAGRLGFEPRTGRARSRCHGKHAP